MTANDHLAADFQAAACNRKRRPWTPTQTGSHGIVVVGDPVPWFGAPLITDGSFNLSVAAGRWIVLRLPRLAIEPAVFPSNSTR